MKPSPLASIKLDALEVLPSGIHIVVGGYRWKVVHRPEFMRLIHGRSAVVDIMLSGAIRYAGGDLRDGGVLRAMMKAIG